MQASSEVSAPSSSAVSLADAQRAATAYVTGQIDPAFAAVGGVLLARPHPQWRFVIRSPHGPLDYLLVNAESGVVVPLTEEEIRMVRERALIADAESRHVLPADAQGHVLAEYARRRANGYMNDHLSLHYSATDPILIPLERPLWQFAIRFRLPRRHIGGIMGTIDVDARTGEPLPLPPAQLARIRERTHALIRPQPSPPAG